MEEHGDAAQEGSDAPRSVKNAVASMLSSYRIPPLRHARFWICQGAVALVFVGQQVATHAVGHHRSAVPLFVITAAYVLPILYSALNLGFYATVMTAGLATLGASVATVHHLQAKDAMDTWADNIQIVIADVVGTIVGHFAETSKNARALAERAGDAHRAAEARYRDLFQQTRAPMALVGTDGTVHEANQAFLAAMGAESIGVTGARLGDLLGADAATAVLSGRGGSESKDTVVTGTRHLPTSAFRAEGTRVTGPEGEQLVQIVFHDVTRELHERVEATRYAAFVMQGQEEERRRIAQELHDVPVQMLIQLCRLLDTPGGNPEVRDLATEIVGSLRHIAKGLRPPVLEDLGLVTSLSGLVREFGERTDINATFDVAGDELRLDPAVELALYRIAQESLANVEKHSGATLVQVELGFRSGQVHFCIVDDGVGLDSGPEGGVGGNGSEPSGLGIVGMRERVQAVGGSIRVADRRSGAPDQEVSEPTGAGTVVEVTVGADGSRQGS